MKRRLLVAVAALAAACARGERTRPQRLTLYCSTQIEWCELMASEFTKETGIAVALTRKSSGEVFAQLWAERRNPRGDVWWGGTGDAHIQAAEAKLTEPYRSPRLAELHPWAIDPAGKGEHRTTGVYMGALGIGYNREWLAKKGLPAPTGWSDLLDPRYKGEIQMANPNSSGTAYTALATIVQLFGEDEGFNYLRKLNASINQYTLSGAAPIRAASRGETGIAVVFLHDVVTEQVAGFPVEMVAPREGTGYEVGCVSVVRGARHLEAAKRWVDFSLSARAQELGARAKSHQVPSNKSAAIPPHAPRPDSLKLLDFDLAKFGSKAERTRLLARWAAEVKGAAR